ncbi:hybrid sensor histidine kinase/response regulator [Demequina salsinemoris]|uniref:hybrid sensor histidine kinase/response regulator n=1 Tax=Demequina salsinemoris TaxID=577470 RepID=UPI000785BA8C|nr:PAS domain-containing sensor histidine kinase [Demequina salsinemoris]
MAEATARRRSLVVTAGLLSLGVVATFGVDLMVQFPIGMTVVYALLIILAMRTERIALILWISAAAVVAILTAELVSHTADTLVITESEHQVARGFQVLGVVLAAVLAVAEVRHRHAAERALAERDTSLDELKGTTAQLHAEQTRTTTLAESIATPVWLMSADGTMSFANRAVREYLGQDPLRFDEWLDVVHAEDQRRVHVTTMRAIEGGEAYSFEARFRSASGEYRAHAVQASPMQLDGTTHWWATAIDVEDLRVTQEQAARATREHLETLHSIGDGVVTLGRDLTITYANPGACAILRRTVRELAGERLVDLYPYLEGSALESAFEEVRSTGLARHLVHHAQQAGGWIDITITPAVDGFTGYMRDVTAEHELEHHRQRTNRLESIGSLTGGIAHDFNNLLTVISGGADALAAEDLSPAGDEMRSMVAEAADRGAGLIRSLLAFARHEALHPEPTSVAEAVAGMRPMLVRTLGDSIAIELSVDDDLPNVLVDRSKLDNAVLNLVINARDAMPGGGRLRIEARRETLPSDEGSIIVDVPSGEYVRLSVEDSGTGIDPEVLDRLFEPFFTTKAPGEGTGLGLAMAWGFAQQSGGALTVMSDLGVGSTFCLHLPEATSTDPAAPASSLAEPPRGDADVLLVEGDAAVRALAASQLGSLGYRVVEAKDGADALQLLAEGSDVDIVVTDAALPGALTGPESLEQIRRARPGVPVLCLSGAGEEHLAAAGRIVDGVSYLAKPYRVQELAVALAALTARHGK